MLARRLSKAAQEYYSGDDAIVIMADDRGDNEGLEVSFDYGSTFSTYSFSELDATLSAMMDELNAIDD